MQVIYHGHSFLELQIEDCIVLIDPFISGNKLASIDKDYFARVDYILLTHGHGDHVGDTVYLAQKHGATVIANPEICQWLKNQWVTTIHGMNIGGWFTFSFAYVYMTQAFHSSALPDGSYGWEAGWFIIQTTDKTLYHAWDTSVFADMAYIGQKFSIDIAFLPIGDNFTMGIDDAIEAAKLLQAQKIVPIHYDTFPVIQTDVAVFKKKIEQIGLVCDLMV